MSIQTTRYDHFHVLYVEDEPLLREEVTTFLKRRVGTVFEAANGEEALAIWKENKINLVITDLLMPHMDGMTLLQLIREADKKVPVMITSAINDITVMQEAIALGVTRFLIKPFQTQQMDEALKSAYSKLQTTQGSSDLVTLKFTFSTKQISLMEADIAKLIKLSSQKGPDKVTISCCANLLELQVKGGRTRMEQTLLQSEKNVQLVDFLRETYYKQLLGEIKDIFNQHLQCQGQLSHIHCDSTRDVDLLKWILD